MSHSGVTTISVRSSRSLWEMRGPKRCAPAAGGSYEWIARPAAPQPPSTRDGDSAVRPSRRPRRRDRQTRHLPRSGHSFAGRLLEDGSDISTVQELLGHKDLTPTMIYKRAQPRAGGRFGAGGPAAVAADRRQEARTMTPCEHASVRRRPPRIREICPNETGSAERILKPGRPARVAATRTSGAKGLAQGENYDPGDTVARSNQVSQTKRWVEHRDWQGFADTSKRRPRPPCPLRSKRNMLCSTCRLSWFSIVTFWPQTRCADGSLNL